MRALLWHRILGQSLCHSNPCRRSSPAYLTATLTTSTETKPPKKFKIPSRYDPYGPRPPPSEKIIKLAEEITNLPLEERKMIGPCLMEKLRAPRIQMISADAVAAAMPQGASLSGGAAKAEEKKAEKTVFNVKLEKFDSAAKIKVIKEVRAFTDLGLKEAKELVEKVPVVIKQGLTKEEAGGIIEKIKAAGGVAVME